MYSRLIKGLTILIIFFLFVGNVILMAKNNHYQDENEHLLDRIEYLETENNQLEKTLRELIEGATEGSED